MVDPKYLNLLYYSTCRRVVLKGGLCWALLYYLLVLAAAIALVAYVMIDQDNYLYKRILKGNSEPRITGYAIGKSGDWAVEWTYQYFDVGDLVYPNSADSSSMFVAAKIVYTDKQVQEYCKIRPCKTNADCEFATTSRDSGVTGEPLKTKECNVAIGFWNDIAWCPTMKQTNRTYVISDFSNININVVSHAESWLNNKDHKRVYSESTASGNSTTVYNLQKLISDVAQLQENGTIVEIYHKFDCSRHDAEDDDCDMDVSIRNYTINESLIQNPSNQTIKQAYSYDYQVNGVDMRDEYQVTGMYLTFRTVFKIKEVDIANIVSAIAILFATMILLHAGIEILLRYSPIMNADNKYRLEMAKFDQVGDDRDYQEQEDDDDD